MWEKLVWMLQVKSLCPLFLIAKQSVHGPVTFAAAHSEAVDPILAQFL